MSRAVLQLVQHGQVAVSGGGQDEGVGEANGPVLGPVHVHLRRGPQDRDGRDEAAGNGHRGREHPHLFVGQQIFLGRLLTSPGKENSNKCRE